MLLIHLKSSLSLMGHGEQKTRDEAIKTTVSLHRFDGVFMVVFSPGTEFH